MTRAAVVAFSCRPHSGSEWGVGWNYLRMIARNFDQVTVFVRDAERQVPETAAGLAEAGISNVDIVAVPDMALYRLFRRPAIHRRILAIYYGMWLWRLCFRFARQRLWRGHDALFHVTWVSDWIFSPLFLLPFRSKYVGPVGSQPANFNAHSMDFLGSRLRVTAKALCRFVLPNIVNALCADAVIGISVNALRRWPWRLARRRQVLSPVFSEMTSTLSRAPQRRVLFIGKQLPFKNFDLFLAVAKRLLEVDSNLSVHVLGDTLGKVPASSNDRLTVHGLVDQAEVGRQLSGFQSVLLQTSSEAGGTVGVESLALGAPVVCVAGYGISAFFEDQYPYAVAYVDRQQFINAATSRLLEIFQDYDSHAGCVARLAERFTLDGAARILGNLVHERSP